MVYVFGSNTGGIHGGGAALAAYKKHGARWGMGYGHYGKSFAIPTKGHHIVQTRVPAADGLTEDPVIGDTLPLEEIKQFVIGFLAYAKSHPSLQFQVTRIGCGLAGLKDEDIAPMFKDAPANCLFDSKWMDWLGENATYWGTYG